jgi:hypothetical protein
MTLVPPAILAALIAAAWVFLWTSIDDGPQSRPYRLGGSLERRLRALAPKGPARKRGIVGLFVALHLAAVVGSTIALWWFVLPDSFGEALADSVKAAGAAAYAELWLVRLRL